MFPSIPIGGAVLPTGPLSIILGLWLGLSGVEWAAKRLGLNGVDTYGVASTGVFAGIFLSRLTFVALHWSAYQDNLLSIIWPLTSGYNLLGGLIGGIGGIFFYARAKQLPPWKTLDALIVGILIILMFASLSDFLAGPGYGESTTLFWGISQFGIRRHPVQIYEILGGLFALATWWLLLPKREFGGQLFLTATALYSAVRLFSDAYRANAWLCPRRLPRHTIGHIPYNNSQSNLIGSL